MILTTLLSACFLPSYDQAIGIGFQQNLSLILRSRFLAELILKTGSFKLFST